VIDVCLLGTGGMMPLPGRWLSSALLRVGGQMLLLDCGEGTQISLKQVGWGFKALGAICISHYHADHVSGLVGMLLMLANSDRTEEVTLCGPVGLRDVVEGQLRIAPYLPFPLRCLELRGGERFSLAGLQARTLAGDHALPCLAYRFDLPRAPRFDIERAAALGVPRDQWKLLQRGEVVDVGGRRVRPEEVRGAARAGLALGYVTDTRPTAAMPGFLEGVDLLICEGMYGDDAQQERAAERKHMTFSEAAGLAREAGAGALWLTHFSPSLERPADYLDNARRVFPNAAVGYDHLQVTLAYQSGVEDGSKVQRPGPKEDDVGASGDA
jgi:ribonuclease Z